jgi:hypothetical protein
MNVLVDDPIKKAFYLPFALSNAAKVNGKKEVRWKLKIIKMLIYVWESCTHLSLCFLGKAHDEGEKGRRIFMAEIYLAGIAVWKEITINFLELLDGEMAGGAVFQESFVPLLYLGIWLSKKRN